MLGQKMSHMAAVSIARLCPLFTLPASTSVRDLGSCSAHLPSIVLGGGGARQRASLACIRSWTLAEPPSLVACSRIALSRQPKRFITPGRSSPLTIRSLYAFASAHRASQYSMSFSLSVSALRGPSMRQRSVASRGRR